jgi:hypothetical protein
VAGNGQGNSTYASIASVMVLPYENMKPSQVRSTARAGSGTLNGGAIRVREIEPRPASNFWCSPVY